MREEPWKPSDKPQGQDRVEDLVRPWVEGMKTLVVSNRMDPDLERRLSEKLGLDITWAVCNIRRAQAQAKGIAKNKYDLVIGQTGFLSHNIEAIIARACTANQIPYIRADKARPVSTAMALKRDLGLDLSQEPPRSEHIHVTAPPQESRNGRTRRRTVVTVPQEPSEYKDLDIDILKFLDKQKTYFRLEDLFRALPGIPLIFDGNGKINWSRMRRWSTAIGQMLRKLNYVNAQISQTIDPERPRVWIRRDRQAHITSVRDRVPSRTPAEISRSQPLPQQRRQQQRQQGSPYGPGSRPRQAGTGLRWMRKYEKIVRSHVKNRLYVHPEDVLRLLGVDLPAAKQIIWQDYMFWTKNIAPIFRKMGFTPRQREFDGRKTRVWVHKSAPRYMPISPPGEEYISPFQDEAPRTTRKKRAQTPVAQAPAPAAPTPVPTSSTGAKAVRISYSSIESGTMEELVLILTQAGWSVSFGP